MEIGGKIKNNEQKVVSLIFGRVSIRRPISRWCGRACKVRAKQRELVDIKQYSGAAQRRIAPTSSLPVVKVSGTRYGTG
jgi:hypothetical protein